MPQIEMKVDGGLNLSVHPSDIGDNELSTAYNVVYEPSSGVMRTRDGITAVGLPLADPITVLYPFTRKEGESWLIAVSGKKLWRMSVPQKTLVTKDGERLVDKDGNVLVSNDGSTEPLHWIEIGPVETRRPSMISFNGKLLVADGSTSGILSWDGTTLSRIAKSPQATALYTIKNRVVANSAKDGELDAVWMSKTEDETGWDATSSGGALGLRAGYGDGMVVNGFSSISSLLLVSKTATVDGKVTAKQFHGIETGGGDASQWSAREVSTNNAAIGPNALVSWGQNALYIDSEGVESMVPVNAYGDVQNDPVVGAKINSVVAPLVSGTDSATATILHRQSAIIFLFDESPRIFLYSTLLRQFTEVEYPEGITSASDYGEATYLGGESGQLYILNGTARDINGDTHEDIVSVVRSRLWEMPVRTLLTKTFARVDCIDPGELELAAFSGRGSQKATLLQQAYGADNRAARDLNLAVEDLADATYSLYAEPERRVESRQRMSFEAIMLQLRTLSGRIAINGIAADVRQVGR